MNAVNILIADDHEAVRRGLRSLIESRPGWSVCAEAVNGKDACEKARSLKPDVILMDVSMPEMNGLDAARLIGREVPDCKTLLISQNDPALMRRAAAEVGAKGFLHKATISQNLVGAVEALALNRADGEATPDGASADAAPLKETISEENPRVDVAHEQGAPARILLAEDNAEMQAYLQGMMGQQYEVITVADGESALARARELCPDLILSDVTLPRVNGFDLLRLVRTDPALKSIPVVLLSALSGEEARVEGLDAGADDYLVTPFTARELLARVGLHVAKSRWRREAIEREQVLRADAELERNQIRELFMHTNRELEERNAEVVRQSEELRDLSWRLLRTQDEERRHIARELHDSAGQTLAVLAMNLAMIVQAAEKNSPAIAESARQTQELVQQLTKEIRTTSYLLHPPLLDENGLPAALSWYIRGLTDRSGLDISFNISEEFGRLPHDMELVVFRMVQECLTNIHRHSGSKTAAIQISREPGRVLVEVRDRGRGMSPARLTEIQSKGSGVGIRGLRERLRQFQGEMIIDSTSGGTTVVVTIPVPEDVEAAVGSTGTPASSAQLSR